MKENLSIFWNNFYRFPKYILFHPFDGYEEMKRYKKGKLSVAIILMAVFGIYIVVSDQYRGYLINDTNPLLSNSLLTFISVFLIFALFVVGNWSITTLISGKGSFKDIVMVLGYSLWPIIIIGFPSVLISNFLTTEEMAFYQILQIIGYVAMGWMIFTGLISAHQYGVWKTILSLILTVIAIAVMLFIALLFFDIVKQITSFISQIFQELRLR